MNQSLRAAFNINKQLLILAACLYAASIFVTFFLEYQASPRQVVKQLEARLAKNERSFNEICTNTSLLMQLSKDSLVAQSTELQELPYGLFFYVLNDVGNPLLTYWNSNQFYIQPEEIPEKDGSFFVSNQNGSFELIKKSIVINQQKAFACAMVPIRWHYFIENKYLHTSFDGFEKLETQYEISDDADALTVLNGNNKPLYKIKAKHVDYFVEYDAITVFLRTISVILLFIILNNVGLQLVKDKGFATGFTALIISVLALRIVTYLLPFPFQFSKLGLFDPSIYASNKIHPSLGHLLINVVLVFWLIAFYKFNSPKAALKRKSIFLYANLIVLLFAVLLAANIIRSLVFDSKISFDVTNFFSLNVYSVISFAILGFLALSIYHLSHILLRQVIANKLPVLYQVLCVLVTGLLYLSITINTQNTTTNLIIIVWLALFVVVINWRKQDIELPILKSSFFIFWMMLLAASCTVLVSSQNKVVEWEQRKKMAERLANQSDPNGENLLAIAMANFDNAALVKNFHRFESEYANKYIKDSLLNENFSGYLNKFDTRIYTFDSLYQPLFNDDSTSYALLKAIALSKGKSAGMPGLYTYQNADDQINYLYEKSIEKSYEKLGYLFVVVKPKQYKSEALYPELFKQVQDLAIDLNTNYAFAVYINGKMINKMNSYDFPTQLNIKNLSAFEYKKIQTNGYTELWYNAGNTRQIIIVKQDAGLIEVATLFAYLFFTFLTLVCCFHIVAFLLRTKFTKASIKQLFEFNIRTQIHTTIIFISLFSFVVVGVATISFFINRFNKTNEDRLSQTIQVMSNEIAIKVKQIRTQMYFDDVLSIYDVGFVNDLERKITEVSEIHNVDVNFFTANGNLIASTQPYIYNKFLLSQKMNPNAFAELRYNKRSRFIQSEHIGELNYISVYLPIFDDDGHIYAYLNIPYLNSQIELTQEISNFIATLINLNAFVFLIAGAIAFLLTERIVSSFKAIADKMQEVNLTKQNQEITWHRKDEIAPLVSEYNAMVQKLEQSAMALAKSEREGAWREMARQVAHEIKNPLTPMKLSIQYLLKAIDNDAVNTKQLSQKVATTLVEQIDQLSLIASDFSQFANINNVQLETFNVIDVIASVVALYNHSEGVTINYYHTDQPCLILADKVQLNRLFTNLIKNATEAVEDEQKTAVIDIQVIKNYQFVNINITDNGKGIPTEMQDKIFTPNFTTKTSGTGLGLAICKGIVENINGTISFTTQANIGTTFSVMLPLVKKQVI